MFIVLDGDEACPADLGLILLQRARAQTNLAVRVVLPKVEIEAWILAGVDSLRGVCGIRGDAEPPPYPETIRDAKGALTRLMEDRRGYVATDDLPALVEQLDLDLTQERSPSFAKFRRDLTSLAHA